MPRKPRPSKPAPEPAPEPTPPPPADGDLPGWRQIFSEDFATPCAEGQFLTTYNGRWSAYPKGWKDTSKHGTYDPGIISVANGVMSMRCHTTPDGVCHVAAPYPLLPVPTVWQYGTPNTPLLYGRYEVRFRADSLPGYKVAWLLWPMSDVWPRDGEIDFPEGDLDDKITGFVHHQEGASGSDQYGCWTEQTFGPWHTAVIEWLPTGVRFLLDGVVVGATSTRIPNTPMRWVLQTETALLPAPAPHPSVAGVVQVDSARVWVPAA